MKGKKSNKKQIRIFGLTLKASAAIEAAVIVPLTLVILAAVITLVLILHDRVIFPTVSIYEVMEQAGGEEDPERIRNSITEMLEKRVLTAEGAEVFAEETEEEAIVEASGTVEIPMRFVRMLLGEESGNLSTRISVSGLNGRKQLIRYKTICDGIRYFTEQQEQDG